MASQKTSLRVLIVEDSEDDAFFLTRVLKQEGYEVTFQQIETETEMRQALVEQTWDVIVSDYQMPSFDGLSALQVYKEYSLDIPFIIVSGAIGEETAVKVMKAGAHDYLIKENLTRLVPAIQRELQEAKIRQERRDALQKLQRSESRYRAIVEDQTELINRSTLQGTITFANEVYARLFDLQSEDMIGKNYREILAPKSYQRLKDVRDSLSFENPVQTTESVHTKKDGTTIWVQWRDRLIFDADQNPIEFQGVGRDISANKRVEQDLKNFAANLERRTLQLRAATEIARDATSVRDLDDLLNRVINLVCDRFGFYYAGVFLIDAEEKYAVLAAATGEAGQKMLADGHKLRIGETGMVGHVIGSGEGRVSLDVEYDSYHYAQPMLPDTRSEMALPLKVGERVIGALDVQSDQENAFDEEDIQILQTMTDQLAVAIDNLRLFTEVQQRARELEGLYNAALVTSRELETEAILGRLYEQVQRFINPDAFIVALYEKKTQEIRLALAMEAGHPIEAFQHQRFPLQRGGLTGYVIRSRKPFAVENLETDDLPVEPEYDPNQTRPTRAWLGIPLIIRDQVLGAVSVQSYQVGAFDESHQRFLESLTSQVAITFENARLFEDERAAREQAETLREIASVISGSLDLDQVLSLILEQIKRVLVFVTASVMLLDDERLTALVAGLGYDDERLTSQSASFMLQDSPILHRMSEDLQPVIIPDVRKNPEWIWIPGAEHVRSFLGVPIIAREKMIGALMVDHTKEAAFSDEDARTIQTIAQHISIAIETVRLFEAERAQLLLAHTLQEVGLLLTSQLGLREVLEQILDMLGRVVHYDSVSVQLMDADHQLYLAAGRGFDDYEAANQVVRELSQHNLKWQAEFKEQVIIVNDTEGYENWISLPEVANIRSWICAPLQARGKLIGLLTVDSLDRDAFSDEIGNTVMAFANQAAIAIENAQLFDAERSARLRAEALHRATQVINSTLSLDQVIQVVLEQLSRVLEYDSGSVILIEGNRAYVQAGIGYDDEPSGAYLTNIEFDLTNETIQYVVQTGEPLVIPDVRQDKRWIHTAVTGHIRSWMGIPLHTRDQVVGLINLEKKTPGGFSDEEIAIARMFANHTSTAIENARLFETEENRAKELETLRRVSLSLTASLEPEAVLNAILEGVNKMMARVWHTHIFLYDQGQLIFESEFWSDPDSRLAHLPVTQDSLMAKVAASGEAVVETDFPLNRLFADLEQEDFRGALVSLPLKIGERVVGVLNAVYVDSQVFIPAQLRVLNLLADQAALAIENAHLFQQTTMERRHISLLYDVGRAVAVSLEPELILKAALDLTCKALDGNIGAAWLYLADQKQLYLKAFYGNSTSRSVVKSTGVENIKIQLGEGWVGRVAENYQPIIRASIDKEDLSLPIDDINMESMIAAPILEGERLQGVIAVHSQLPSAFDNNQLNLLQAICQQISLGLSNARRYQDVDRLVSLLAAEQYRLEGLIEMLPVGILLLDERHNLLVINSLAREFLSALAPDEIGLTISHLGPHTIAELLDRHQEPLPLEIALEGLTPKTFEVQAQPLGTDTIQWIITLRDVTQEREIQERIQMQERLATVGQLAAGIAHDFNNIMAAIIVYADLLLMDQSISITSQERLRIIQQQVQRAASLIRQILDFSRRSVMEQSTLDLLSFLKEMEKLLTRTLPETIRVELHHQDAEYIISADPTRLQQVFMNLAVNARDAMPEGGKLRFALSHIGLLPNASTPTPDMPTGNWILASVSDTGIGIPVEDQSHIFEPFFTTKPVGQGTGLGLAQVYGIVKQHGGYINIKSQVDEGTQFDIYLPSLVDAPESNVTDQNPEKLDGSGKTVLLVEDDATTRKALNTMLRVHNYHVLPAENGLKALELLRQDTGAIELVISDIVMPEMGGLELYKQIQQHWPEILVLLITGHPLDEQNQELLQGGKVHWLQKPFTVQEFNQTLVELFT